MSTLTRTQNAPQSATASAGAWRPVQGPDSLVPGTRAGTGHVVGVIYAPHYGRDDLYRCDIAHADGSVTVHALTGSDAFDMRPRNHRTNLNPDGRRNVLRDDHPVWEECRNRWACRERSDAWADAVASLLAEGFANVV